VSAETTPTSVTSREIEAFRDHLRADEHVDVSLATEGARERLLVRAARLRIVSESMRANARTSARPCATSSSTRSVPKRR
jgi:hypothetical protein